MMNFPVSDVPGHMPWRPFKDLHSHSRDSGRMTMHDFVYNNKVSAPSSAAAAAAAAIARPPGPIALIRSIISVYGFRGLWLGHTGTLFRETGGCAAWFIAKEWVARKLVERRLQHTPHTNEASTLLAWESALSGAIAGAVAALMFYPADTVKSAIQTEEELRPRGKVAGAAKGTFLGTCKEMYVRHGFKGLYAGCGMTVARAVLSSGIIFVVYDGLSAWSA